jgi:outer membrane protein
MCLRIAKPLRLLSAVLISVSALPIAVHAAQVITLDDAIGIALERNVPLLQARTTVQLSDVAVSAAKLQFLPNLSLTTTGTRNYGRYYSPVTGSYVNETTSSLSPGASSGVTLFTGLHDVATLRQAKLGSQASKLDLSRAQETAVFTAVSNFLSLILQQEQLQVQRENLAAEMMLEEQIHQYVTSGTRASADLYQQQANVAAARLSVIQAENAAELGKVDLLRTLQLDPIQTYDFQAPAIETIYRDDSTTLQDLVAHALSKRVDLQAEEARVDALDQGVHVASSGYWPTVSLSTGYGSSYTNALPESLHDQLDVYRNGSVSLNVSIPLFDSGVTRSAVHRAQLEAQNERITLASQRHEVELQMKSVYLDYHAAREELTAAQAQQHTAQLAVQSAQERFKAGTAILVEVSQERMSYVVAQGALATARYNLALQSIQMKYYLGEIRRGEICGEEGHGQEDSPPSNPPPFSSPPS